MLLPLLGAIQAQQTPLAVPAGCALQIESFTSVRGYAVGSEAITLVGTIRNIGTTALPADTAKARLYCLAGLDYNVGETSPRLPALEPNAAVTFKFSVVPSSAEAPLIASLAVEMPGGPPLVRIAVIPHLVYGPGPESAAVARQPAARAGRGEAVLENSSVRARVIRSPAGIPILLLSTHTIGGWRQVGISVPLAEVLSAEGGQRPWWEVFKLDETQSTNTATESTLVLSGAFGLRWRATIDLKLRTDSSVIDARLRLSPEKPMRLSGLRFCPLLAGEGSFGATATESLGPEPSGPNIVTAVRWGEVTVGTLRPSVPPLLDWDLVPMPVVEGAEYRLMGAEHRARESPAFLAAGAMVEIRSRLFALTPSLTVRDSLKVTFATPAQSPKAARSPCAAPVQ